MIGDAEHDTPVMPPHVTCAEGVAEASEGVAVDDGVGDGVNETDWDNVGVGDGDPDDADPNEGVGDGDVEEEQEGPPRDPQGGGVFDGDCEQEVPVVPPQACPWGEGVGVGDVENDGVEDNEHGA